MRKLDTEMIVTDGTPKHGSPQDRGSADRYYGRNYEPHYWPNGTGHGSMITMEEMSPAEIVAYDYGWKTETDRKDWG